MKKRLFLAIEMPSKIKEKISAIQNKLRLSRLGATWVKPGNMHVTLVFIGDTDYNQIPEIIGLLSSLRDDAFEVSFSEISGFPSQNKANIIWLGFKENLALYYLQEKIKRRLEEINIKSDNKLFAPHLTIARLDRPKNLEKLKLTAGTLGKFSVRQFILYESELKSDGPKHIPIKKFKLL